MERVIKAMTDLRIAMLIVSDVTAKQYADATDYLNAIEDILSLDRRKMVDTFEKELKNNDGWNE